MSKPSTFPVNMQFRSVFRLALFFSILGFSPGFIVFLVLLFKFNGISFYTLDNTGLWIISILALIAFILIASTWAFLLTTVIFKLGNFIWKQLESQGVFKSKKG